MTIAEITKRFIEYSDGNLHDIAHFMKVHGYARTIGQCEGLNEEELYILETAALIHDIACPLCRKKYGNTNGKYQEIEGEVLAREFLESLHLEDKVIDRVVYLVSHHHTYTNVEGIDYQILLEADYLVNADESNYSKENITNMYNTVFLTDTGKQLLSTMYGLVL